MEFISWANSLPAYFMLPVGTAIGLVLGVASASLVSIVYGLLPDC
jgi:hypothetical protein